MGSKYFERLRAETDTRVWVNNPTLEEVGLALAQGAFGSTTNPAYGGNLLRRAPQQILPIIEEVAAGCDDDGDAAQLVQLRVVKRIVDAFRPMYDASGGMAGFVSCQGDPEADTAAEDILRAAHATRELGPNATPKIPATLPGFAALERLVAEGSPTIVTEVFSLAQLVEANERYLAVTAKTGHTPPFFLSPITGIFGDHLKGLAARDGIVSDPRDTAYVGVILARACYELCEARSYPVTLLAGGARIPFDLTGLAGARVHATINWSTFADILSSEPDPAGSYSAPMDPSIVRRLEAAFPEVRQALSVDGLGAEAFEAFGPVQFFRNSFIAGWQNVMAAIAEARRQANPSTGRG